MKSRGFTIIELLIVIIVMAILLTLAVINIHSTQAQARDNERHVDVENIATALESFYNANHAGISRTYPGVLEAFHSPTSSYAKYFYDRALPDSLYAPGVDKSGTINSFVEATNELQTPETIQPQPTLDTYIYQPLTPDNELCTEFSLTTTSKGCAKFNIYYQTERSSPSNTDAECTNTMCVYRSKHR